MKVLIISRGVPSSADPVYGNIEVEQACALRRIGYDVKIIYVDRRTKVKFHRTRGINSIIHKGIETYGIFYFPLPVRVFPKLAIIISCFLGKMLYKKKISNWKPDLIHSHYLFNLPIAVAIKKKYHIPIVATEHWSALESMRKLRYVKVLSKYYKYSDSIISVSRHLASAIKRVSGAETTVIYNMVADDFFVPNVTDRKFPHARARVKFASVGNLVKLKGYDVLISAFKKVQEDNVAIELDIIGDGPERDDLERMVASLDLGDNISFHGKKGKNEVISLLCQSDCFVLSSRSETFGVVYAEAMAVGIPVIATDCGGPSEFVNANQGLLVPVGDVNALAEAMEKFARGEFKYSGNEIREYCRSLFSSASIANQISNIYKSVIANGIKY